ncbi:MAG: hypothetical protein ACXVPQ_13200 [Bacteroidia bacterium]
MKLRLLIIFFAFVLVLSPSCQRKRDCIIYVSCKDSLGVAKPGITIQLYSYSTGTDAAPVTAADLKAQGLTDNTGRANFTFKLPGMYKVVASSVSGTGSGVVKSQEGRGVLVQFVVP